DVALTPKKFAAAGGLAFSNSLHARDEKPSGTGGGTFTNGAWRTRDLNTLVRNSIQDASLANNQLTLPAGTYEVDARVPANGVSVHKAVLTTTSGSTLLVSAAASNVTGVTDDARIHGRIVLTEPTALEIRHWGSVTRANIGFGE